jgi:hypothetical protein
MAQFGRYRFLLIAVVFHLLYIWSCFSTYFTSPIVHGMREHRVETQEAPAKRLVLFVGESRQVCSIPSTNGVLQVTASVQTKHFNRFPIPTPILRPLSQTMQLPHVLSPHSFALASSSMALLAFPIHGCLLNPDLDMLHSSQAYTRTSQQSRPDGS